MPCTADVWKHAYVFSRMYGYALCSGQGTCEAAVSIDVEVTFAGLICNGLQTLSCEGYILFCVHSCPENWPEGCLWGPVSV